MTDDNFRDALQRKLRDPKWIAQQERNYDRIVGSSGYVPIVLDMRLPPKSALAEYIGGEIPQFDEPTTIEGLWLDRWQRSSAAYTITRMPEGVIRLDYPTGARRVSRVCRAGNNGFTWTTEEFDPAGRRIVARRAVDRFESEDEALFEMHRAALSEFDDLTNEF